MIRREDETLEKMVLAGESCIAVPIEIFVPADGEPQLTVYSFLEGIAAEFYNIFKDDLLSVDALKWLDDRISASVKEIGYGHFQDDSHMLAEYKINDNARLPNNVTLGKVVITKPGDDLNSIDLSSFDSINFTDTYSAICIFDCKAVSVSTTNDIAFSDHSVEICVETLPEYEGRGFGTAVVAELCRFYLSEGKTVKYECAKANTASVKIAEKCGLNYCGCRYSYVCYAIEEDA